MKKVTPFYNYGRWLARCPECGSPNPVELGDEMFVCGSQQCYPEKTAKKFAVLEGKVVVGIDATKQKMAKIKAFNNNEVYEIGWHRNSSAIERELRKRKIIHQSFVPEEEVENFPDIEEADTLPGLRKEIEEDPRLSYLKNNKNEKKVSKKKEVEEIEKEQKKPEKSLSEAMLRRIK